MPTALRRDHGLPGAIWASRRGAHRAPRRDPKLDRIGDDGRLRTAVPSLHRAAAQGWPPTGRFLQLVDAPGRDAAIRGEGYSFRTLIAAQAAGDLETLRAHGLPAERVLLEGDPAAAVRALTEQISGLLQGD